MQHLNMVYANIPYDRLAYVLEESKKTRTPASFVIRKDPGHGVLSAVREAYPEAAEISILGFDEMAPVVAEVASLNVGKMIVLDIDAPDVVLNEKLCMSLVQHINNKGRLIITANYKVTIESQALESRLLAMSMI